MKRGDVVIFAAKFEAKVEISTERWMNALHSDSRLSVQQGRCAENRFRRTADRVLKTSKLLFKMGSRD